MIQGDPIAELSEVEASGDAARRREAEALLRRAGLVVLLLGLVALGLSVYTLLATGGRERDYNLLVPLLLVLGVLLRRGSLPAARVAAFLSAFVLALMAGHALLVFVLPLDLIWAYLRLRPPGAVGAMACHGVALGAVVWIHLTLTESVVLAVQEADSRGRRRYARRPWAGLVVGGVLSLLGVIAFNNVTKGADWIEASAEVQRQLGPECRTFVTGVDWTDADGPSPTEACAIAYNDHTYRRVSVSWEGSPPRPLRFRDVTASDDPRGPGRRQSTWRMWIGP